MGQSLWQRDKRRTLCLRHCRPVCQTFCFDSNPMSSTIRTIVKKNENIRNATREVWEPFQLYQSYHNWVECHRWPSGAPVCVCRSLARIDTCGEFGLYKQSSGSHPSDAHRSRAVGESHMGPEDTSNRKKITIIFLKPNFRKLQNNFKNVSLRIGSSVPQKLGPFFSLFLMRKPLLVVKSGLVNILKLKFRKDF